MATAPLPGKFQHFQLAHHAQTTWVARPRYHDTLEDVLKPGYWSHVARELKPESLIRIMPEGLEWYAELIVIEADQISAKVKLLHHVRLTEQAVRKEAAGAFKTDQNGKWWRVIRVADQSVAKTGFHGEAEALAWILENAEA